MRSNPSVVIVGRMNVGKSSLFNRLSSDVKSMTLDYEGVTRDFVKDTVCWKDNCFDLIDTGGITLRDTPDPIARKVQEQVLNLVQEAALVLFVCDGTVGLLPEDREIARVLHRQDKQVLVVVNKIDSQVAKDQLYEFDRLGFAEIVPVSCAHALGINELLDSICAQLPQQGTGLEEEKTGFKIVLLGKPNVGKSSLMNELVKSERSIVLDMPGTTREAISERVTFYQQDVTVTDTPGVRRKKSVDEGIEQLMVHSSFRALDEADIVLLLIDASEGTIADQELKLAFYAFAQKQKALIMLFNKTDLMTDEKRADLEFSLEPYEFLTKKLMRLDISCKTGKNVGRIMAVVQEVWERHTQKFSNDDLTFLFQEALRNKPLYHKTELLKLFRVRQVKTAPLTFLLIVNQPMWFGESQLGFFENLMRKAYDLRGVPIVFIPRVS